MKKDVQNKAQKIFLFLVISYISAILSCSRENKKNIPEEITSKISYAISSSVYFIKNLQNFIENLFSIQGECVKKENNNKRIYDNCKLSDSPLTIQGQLEEQGSKYIMYIAVSDSDSGIKAELSGEVSLIGGRFLFENISLYIKIIENGIPQEGFFSLSGISSIKFRGGYTIRNEQEKTGKIKIEFGDRIDLDLINFEYTQYQNGISIDATIKGQVNSYGGCIEKNIYDIDIRTKSEIRESGEGPSIIIPICPVEITGTINSDSIEIKKDLCSTPKNICKFLR